MSCKLNSGNRFIYEGYYKSIGPGGRFLIVTATAKARLMTYAELSPLGKDGPGNCLTKERLCSIESRPAAFHVATFCSKY